MNEDKSTSLEPDTRTVEAARQLAEWAELTRKAKKGYATPRVIKKHAIELAEMLKTNTWTAAKPSHLVALYQYCHTKVYGAPDSSVENGWEYIKAANQIKNLVKKEFDDQILAAVEFVKWVWQREAWREKQAATQNQTRDFRMGWKFQFSSRLVTDYRVDKARMKGL